MVVVEAAELLELVVEVSDGGRRVPGGQPLLQRVPEPLNLARLERLLSPVDALFIEPGPKLVERLPTDLVLTLRCQRCPRTFTIEGGS
jgi:hypothetical protein